MFSSSTTTQSPILRAWNEGIQLDDFIDLTKKPENTTWHDIYTDTADALSYVGMSDGCCHGFASAGPVAFWVSILGHPDEGLKTYFSRISTLLSARKSNALNQLNTSLDVHCFFSRIKLIQQSQGYKTKQLFDKPSYSAEQREAALEGIIKPKIIEDLIRENPWRIVANNQTGVYTLNELELFVRAIASHLGNLPFELDMNSGDHRVEMCYCPTRQEWLLFDANEIPLCVFKATDTVNLAKQLKRCLFGGDGYTIFTTAIKSIPLFNSQISACIERLKSDATWVSIHNITNEKALATDKFGFSALMIAAEYDDVRFIETLIKAGANVNLPCFDTGVTPLILSMCGCENENIMRVLLAAGADPNYICSNGIFPLYEAATRNLTNATRILLEAGANANQVNPDTGLTPLSSAIKCGHNDAAYILSTYKPKSEKVHRLSDDDDNLHPAKKARM